MITKFDLINLTKIIISDSGVPRDLELDGSDLRCGHPRSDTRKYRVARISGPIPARSGLYLGHFCSARQEDPVPVCHASVGASRQLQLRLSGGKTTRLLEHCRIQYYKEPI